MACQHLVSFTSLLPMLKQSFAECFSPSANIWGCPSPLFYHCVLQLLILFVCFNLAAHRKTRVVAKASLYFSPGCEALLTKASPGREPMTDFRSLRNSHVTASSIDYYWKWPWLPEGLKGWMEACMLYATQHVRCPLPVEKTKPGVILIAAVRWKPC